MSYHTMQSCSTSGGVLMRSPRADRITYDPQMVSQAAVVGDRERLREKVRETPCGPRLEAFNTGMELIQAHLPALIEELSSFSTQSPTIFNRKGENVVRSHITKHTVLTSFS